jgi:aminopeptidase N
MFARSTERYAPVPEWYQDYDVKFYKIDICADNSSANIAGYAEIVAEICRSGLECFTLELDDSITVDSVCINGRSAQYRRANHLLHVACSPERGEICTVTVYYAAANIKNNGFFSAVSNKADKWKIPVTWTLSEPNNAGKWFPCKQYLPDKADSAHIFITVPHHLKAGAPGVLAAVTPMPDNRLRYEWKTRYPLAYYLLSFAVSDYREYLCEARPEGIDHPVAIQHYIYNNDDFFRENKTAIDTTGALLELFSKLYLPYPFAEEKYGHCVAPMGGGMEHQTMTTISDFEPTLIAHELSHQWFGDMVTCASFQDVWVNEGFASYSEYLALEHLVSPDAATEWMKEAHFRARWSKTGSVFVPQKSAGDVWRIFNTDLSYKKGAALVHYIRYIVGDDNFFDILRGFLRKYAFATATATDFKHFAEQQTNIDLTSCFEQWYFGEGYPVFDVSWKNADGKIELLAEHVGSAAVTPLFATGMDVRLERTDGTDTLVQISVATPHDVFTMRVSGEISSVVVDPGYYVLKDLRSNDRVKDLPTNDHVVHCNTHITRRQNIEVHLSSPARNCRLLLTDADGNAALPSIAVRGKNVISLPAAELPNGAYLLYVVNGDEQYVRKIVKTTY